MKQFLILIMAACLTMNVAAQTEKISINVIVPQSDIPAEARNHLTNKLQQIVSNYGMADNGLTDRFYMTANVLITSKDIVSSTPTRVSQKLEVVLYVGDVIANKLYGTLPINITGVGQNENKAFINAFQKMPVQSTYLENYMDVVYYKILSYYENSGNDIIKNAQLKADMGEYDAAMEALLSIPDVCGEIADSSRQVLLDVYKKKIAKEGRDILQKAKTLWVTNQDINGAKEVLSLLSEIKEESGYASERDALISSIQTKVNELLTHQEEQKQKEWDFQMKQYQDNLELQRQQLKDQTAIERAKATAIITASKKIGEIDINKVVNIVSGWYKQKIN